MGVSFAAGWGASVKSVVRGKDEVSTRRSVKGCKLRMAKPICALLLVRAWAKAVGEASLLGPLHSPSSCANESVPIWPHPASVFQGNTTTYLTSPFKITYSHSIPTLASAVERYLDIIFPYTIDANSVKNESNRLATLHLELKGNNFSEKHPQLETDERYALYIPNNDEASLKASTIYGILRGLETFSQLVEFHFDSYRIYNTPWMVEDEPRFAHRGVMIDTSRHFLPLGTIRRVIDSLAYAKFNVLHWHMSDDPSFPMQSHSQPLLWEGAFSRMERYMLKDIAKIVEYARLRGIRVVVEFDMPGHAKSWCKGIPEICPSKDCNSPLDVSSDTTFKVISDILREMTGGKAQSGTFPDDFIHLGGDEVDTKCWETIPRISAWLKEQNYTADDGYMYFVDRVGNIAASFDRRPIQWVEVFDHFGSHLNERTVVHVWKNKTTLRNVVKAGYNAILSNAKSLYLDHENTTWEAMYIDDPYEGIDDRQQQMLILGGQAHMWGERVDASDIDSTIWPRAAAVAERLWSPRHIKSTTCALPRLQHFRCLLLFRGIGAAPVLNNIARKGPKEPGSCYAQ